MQIYTGCTPESITSSMLLLRLNATLVKAESAWAPATRKPLCLYASISFHVSICFRFRQPNRQQLKWGSKILTGLATVCHLVREKEGRLHLFMWVCKLLKWNICSDVIGAFGALDLYLSPPPDVLSGIFIYLLMKNEANGSSGLSTMMDYSKQIQRWIYLNVFLSHQ